MRPRTCPECGTRLVLAFVCRTCHPTVRLNWFRRPSPTRPRRRRRRCACTADQPCEIHRGRYFSLRGAARYLGVTYSSLRYMVHTMRIRVIRFRYGWRIDRRVLDQLAGDLTVPPVDREERVITTCRSCGHSWIRRLDYLSRSTCPSCGARPRFPRSRRVALLTKGPDPVTDTGRVNPLRPDDPTLGPPS